MEITIKIHLYDFHVKAIPANPVIDMASLGSNKEPISLHHIMVISSISDGNIQDLL